MRLSRRQAIFLFTTIVIHYNIIWMPLLFKAVLHNDPDKRRSVYPWAVIGRQRQDGTETQKLTGDDV